MRIQPLVLAVLAIGFGPTSEGAAQRLSFRPQIGFYVPTEQLLKVSQSGEVAKLEAGPSFGAALGVWFGSRFGIEASGSYVPTTFKLGTDGAPESQDAKLFLGSAVMVLYLLPRTSPVTVFLNGGLGVISRGGVAFTSQSKTSDLTGVFGGGVGINLGGLALMAGADLFAYRAAYEGNQQVSSELTQRDFSLRLGLGVPFGAR